MKSVLFPNSVFSILILNFSIFSVFMVKLNFINKESLYNELSFTVLALPNTVFHYFLEILDFLMDTELISVIWTMRWTLLLALNVAR